MAKGIAGNIESTIAAAKRFHADKIKYIYATAMGYRIRDEKPPGLQQYVEVHPDGTTKTISFDDRQKKLEARHSDAADPRTPHAIAIDNALLAKNVTTDAEKWSKARANIDLRGVDTPSGKKPSIPRGSSRITPKRPRLR